MWKHDRHEEVAGGPLAARLHNREARPRPDTSLVTKALGFKAQQQPSLSIKGASETDERVIEVKGLVAGTSADDVKVCPNAHTGVHLLLIICIGNLSKLWADRQNMDRKQLVFFPSCLPSIWQA